MKHLHIKLLSVILCLTVIGTVIVGTRISVQAASSPTLMYYNDRAWPRGDSHPMEKIYSTLYVPVTLFAQLPNVTVKKNEGQHLFVIANGDDYWLTFNFKTDFAYTQDSDPMYWKSAFYHGDYYVPVRSVCSYLHLQFEEMTSPVTGEVAIRISDGTHKKPFAELIRSKYPGFFPPETTETTAKVTEPPPVTTEPPPPITTETTAKVTEPPITSDTTSIDTGSHIVTKPPETTEPPPKLEDRVIYITIEDSPGKYTDNILRVLDEFDYPATFFLIGNQLVENAHTVSQIAARGHAIGLHTMHHSASKLTDSEKILAELEEENLILSRIIKQKSHIWRAPEGSAKLPALTSETQLTLRHKGYVTWDYNVSVPTTLSASRAAETAIDGIWDNETVILRFPEDDSTAEVLREVLTFISENSDVCDVRAISPAYYEYSSIG